MALYDCSHRIEAGMQVYPDDPAVAVESHATSAADGYRVSRVRVGSHAGTHVDAPSHTEANGKSLDSFDIGMFRFDARLVDLQDLGARDSIPADRLPDHDGDLLALRTGWDEHWGTDRYFDHPYLAESAAERCAARGHHVAIDALSVDPTPSETVAAGGLDEPDGFPAHHALLGNDRLLIENMTNLDLLPECFTLHAYPLALGVDGAPVRAVAETDE